MSNPSALSKLITSSNLNYDRTLIKKAWYFSKNSHQGQFRESGEEYFSHPVSVAYILAEFHLDAETIVTAILHDVVEDCNVSIAEIKSKFGSKIAELVDGVTKLSQIEIQSHTYKSAENFRKFFLATSDDIRILLVKLADRTHNMRTIGGVKELEKRQKISQETLDIFAPLSERVGIISLQNEMEDLAFAVLQPQMRSSIMNRLNFLTSESKQLIPDIIAELRSTLNKGGIKVTEISGRIKTPFSIWKKMQRSKVAMDQLSDIMAFRVLVDNTSECYMSLGLIHEAYPNVMGRFKDYISTKKRNGYQSIHTGVIGPFKQKIEIQIRTLEMHSVAEAGIAAHWAYKDGIKDNISHNWIKDLVSILDQENSPEDFLENTKMEMYKDQVFCFTPKGDLIALPRGASIVDFAYAVHSDIGNSCIGATINGKSRRLNSILDNGDQVNITTSSRANPQPEWENFLKTGRARAEIKKFVRYKRQNEFKKIGVAILENTFRKFKIEYKLSYIKKNISFFNKYGFNEFNDLLVAIGEDKFSSFKVMNILFPNKKIEEKLIKIRSNKSFNNLNSINTPDLNIKGLIPGMAVHYAKCCSPLPGEKIVGIVTTGKGITIHTIDCSTLEKFYDIPERWLDIHWDKDGIVHHVGRISVVISNKSGSLAEITTLISNHQGNISNLQLINRETRFFKFLIDLEVSNLDHLNNVIMSLRSSPFVDSVDRYKS